MAENVFKVDTLVHSLKELQQEKHCLEQKLSELRTKRRNLEGVLETVNSKYAQVRDTNVKMMETLKLAQHKVMQTQAQANSLENSNNQKRASITELNTKIDKEKSSQLEQVKSFERELKTISSRLNDAKHFYTDDNLETLITGACEKISNTQTQVHQSRAEVDILSEELKKLQLKRSTGGDKDEYGVSIEERKQLWKLLKDENDSSQKSLESLEGHLKELKMTLKKESSSVDQTETHQSTSSESTADS